MMQSYVIDVAGTFAGAAIRTPSPEGESFRFIAVDPRVGDLDRSEWPSLEAVRRAASHMLRTGQLPTTAVGA
ncbi:MAG TPA: hypothetical protein VMF62_13995 [Acetobacteraceae bacterium]|jgi:hypothetical protein|nr:hypothetical protein [Acetobacteraceae bacterium]